MGSLSRDIRMRIFLQKAMRFLQRVAAEGIAEFLSDHHFENRRLAAPLGGAGIAQRLAAHPAAARVHSGV